MPCSPVNLAYPPGPNPLFPGFSPPTVPPGAVPFPLGFPEDLLDLFNSLLMLLPPGGLRAPLNPNFGKDIFDAIIKLLDQFMPFLMLYKFFLPILNLIICIIEVLCALSNPIALTNALIRLFTVCLPPFLNLFPIFALILMIIALILLLIKLIEYILAAILALIAAILRNINALAIAFQSANDVAILAIAQKLAALLCAFSNLFVLLSLFAVIIEVIKDILSMLFSIPPCEQSSSSGCCSPSVCPAIVQNSYTNTTGTFQYLSEIGVQTTLPLPNNAFLTVPVVPESWQLFDTQQTVSQAFINIVDGYDIPSSVQPTPIFFPTDANYSATTAPAQAAYTIDLRLFYNPSQWGRFGTSRFIKFNDCIVLSAPTRNLENYANQAITENTGVLYLAGGSGFEDDGYTILTGYDSTGIVPTIEQATLENFIHMDGYFAPNPVLSPSDGYTFSNMQYTFKPNIAVLLQKNLVTLGCDPGMMLSRAFVNNVMFGNVGLQTTELTGIVSGPNFPDPAAAQDCLANSITTLQNNMTTQGVADFQTTTTICLNNLQNNCNNALNALISLGVNPCESSVSLSPTPQFTTQVIEVSVELNENSGQPITTGLPEEVAQEVATQIVPYITFGKISDFVYDGYQNFVAQLSSKLPGTGSLMVAFNNNILCTNNLPTDGSSPTHTLQSVDYQFIYAPAGSTLPIPATGEGDTKGQPQRKDGS